MKIKQCLAAALALVPALAACGSSTTATPSSSPSISSPPPSASQPAPLSKYQQLQELASRMGFVITVAEGDVANEAADYCSKTDKEWLTIVTTTKDKNKLMLLSGELDVFCPSSPNPVNLAISELNASKESQSASQAAEAAKLKPTDFTLAVKILKQSCFGSAGCNVSYRVTPTYVGNTPTTWITQSYDVTYTVIGDESGPQINTFMIDRGVMSSDAQNSASTRSSTTVLSARVTDVSVR